MNQDLTWVHIIFSLIGSRSVPVFALVLCVNMSHTRVDPSGLPISSRGALWSPQMTLCFWGKMDRISEHHCSFPPLLLFNWWHIMLLDFRQFGLTASWIWSNYPQVPLKSSRFQVFFSDLSQIPNFGPMKTSPWRLFAVIEVLHSWSKDFPKLDWEQLWMHFKIESGF